MMASNEKAIEAAWEELKRQAGADTLDAPYVDPTMETVEGPIDMAALVDAIKRSLSEGSP